MHTTSPRRPATQPPRSRPAPRSLALAGLTLAAGIAASAPAQAAVSGFTSRSAFDAAAAAWSELVYSFETVASGTTISNGGSFSGAGFSVSTSAAPANLPTVSSTYWTTSGTHYLGLNNGDTAFLNGDSVTFTTVAPMRGLGLYVIGGSDIQAGDITLTAGGVSVSNVATAALTDNAGSYAWFLGVLSTTTPLISSFTLTSGSAGLYVFAVDDVVTVSTVPEPAAAWLALAGLGAIGALARRNRASTR